MQCAGCGVAIELATGERVGFRDACDGCGTDLHSCVHCRHRDPAAYNGCRESSAERVSDPERANRCDYFSPAAAGEGLRQAVAENPLDTLFKKG